MPNDIDEIKRRAGITEDEYSADPAELIIMLRNRVDDSSMSDAQFRQHIRHLLPAFE